MDVLVLSHSYIPLTRVSWYRAFNMVLTGRAEIVEEYEDQSISSYSETFPMPAVIRFVRVVHSYFRRGIRFNRANIWLRDKGKCQYCRVEVSLKEYQKDHVLPQSQGGKTNWDNIVCSCAACNQKKANRTPREAGMRLRVKPCRPSSLPQLGVRKLQGTEVPVIWQPYLPPTAFATG
jgi:5-methylcytosine-specific restriction endonuclease McrA